MKISQILERSGYTVSQIDFGNDEVMQHTVDLINAGGQLSWTLTIPRLRAKIGNTGRVFILFSNQQQVVGVIAIKEMHIGQYSGGEIGYLYVDPAHRSYSNALQLYNAAVSQAGNYAFLMATTNVANATVNTLLGRVSGMEQVFTAKSKFSSNRLNYWVALKNNGQLDFNQIVDLLKDEFDVQTEQVTEAYAFMNLFQAPAAFRDRIAAVAQRVPGLSLEQAEPGDVQFVFGRQANLPTEKNVVYVGNKFYPKDKQMALLRTVVPTIETYSSAADIDGQYIAKRKVGQRQQGQLVNTEPDDPENYVFQPLLDIKAEYRAVVFYINGSYVVSGVYKKTGSNVSFQSITTGQVYNTVADLAIKATAALGYGLSGVDIAVVEQSPHVVNENVVGRAASALGKFAGKFANATIGEDEIAVVLECNTMPSMSNPMILTDMLAKAKSMAVD